MTLYSSLFFGDDDGRRDLAAVLRRIQTERRIGIIAAMAVLDDGRSRAAAMADDPGAVTADHVLAAADCTFCLDDVRGDTGGLAALAADSGAYAELLADRDRLDGVLRQLAQTHGVSYAGAITL